MIFVGIRFTGNKAKPRTTVTINVPKKNHPLAINNINGRRQQTNSVQKYSKPPLEFCKSLKIPFREDIEDFKVRIGSMYIF